MKWAKWSFLVIASLCVLAGCRKKQPAGKDDQPPSVVQLERPEFSSDSAYVFVKAQVDMGPRVPGSAAHEKCADWLAEKLGEFGAAVTVQTATVKRYDNRELPMYNIIGSFNPDNPVRILLCAHWDTRHMADQDIQRMNEPIPGANDGGSGVGVLLEVARQLHLKNTGAGVDIIFFDAEDQGQPDGLPFKPDTYCLGSQYWARNPHIPNYKAKAGILLDMVGAADAVFTLEGTSMNYAPAWMRQVWDNAINLGHSKYFSYERTEAIIDDHLYINRIRKIPTIDIIQRDFKTQSGFGSYWHTHDDTMDVISKATLQAVGETVLATVYSFK